MKKIITKQYQEKVNQAIKLFGNSPAMPSEGWVRTVRNALNMSTTQLGKRIGLSRGRVSQAELDEVKGAVSLKTMKSMASAMDARFVYAIVPERSISEIIKDQAIKKAKDRVMSASTQMALEDQTLEALKLEEQIQRIASEIIDKMPSDLWNDE